jgi:hypothetical protein
MKPILLREKCLSVILLAAISEYASAQINQGFPYNDTTKYLGDCKLLEIKNKKWDFNGCQLKIISETHDTITLKPFNSTQSKEDIEIDVVVEHDGRTSGRLYVILAGEKHEVNLTSIFSFGSRRLILNYDGTVRAAPAAADFGPYGAPAAPPYEPSNSPARRALGRPPLRDEHASHSSHYSHCSSFPGR